MGVVWAEFVTTSITLITTSKKPGYGRHGGPLYMLKGPGENTACICTCRLIEMLLKITTILSLWTLTITLFAFFFAFHLYVHVHAYVHIAPMLSSGWR